MQEILHWIIITVAVVLLSVTETSGEGMAHLLRRVLLAERRDAHGSCLHYAVACRNAFRLDCNGACDYCK